MKRITKELTEEHQEWCLLRKLTSSDGGWDGRGDVQSSS